MEMLTIVEYRNKYGKSPYTIKNGIINGRFPDAVKRGGKWYIPDTGTVPDRRFRSGEYVGWRNKDSDE